MERYQEDYAIIFKQTKTNRVYRVGSPLGVYSDKTRQRSIPILIKRLLLRNITVVFNISALQVPPL
jgi:hypothetical protein